MQQLQQYTEIGVFLQDGVALEKIALLQAKLEEQHYYIPIIGQFSSGKSSFINNLIGRRILPTMLSETTAYTTFLYYGEQEYAEIVTEVATHRFDIEKLMELSQRNLQTDMSVSEILGMPPVLNSDIVCINVYVHHDMFKTGLVFVDTPGLNTILSTHENRTSDILPKAHSIIYVMGKSLTAADMQLVEGIDQLGIDIVFIRTKLDELRRDENDTPSKIMTLDQLELEEAIGRQATYFGVTNEADLLIFPHWKTLIDNVKQFLQLQFVQNIEAKRQESVTRRLQQIEAQFKQNLEERKQHLEVSQSVTDAEIQQKIANLQEEISYVDLRVKSKEKTFQLTFNATKEAILQQYTTQFQLAQTNYQEALNQYGLIESLQQQAELVAQQQINEITEQLKHYTNHALEMFLQKAAADTNEALQTNVGSFSLGELPNVQLHVEVPTIQDVFVQGEFIQDKLGDAELYEKKLQEIEQQREQANQQAMSIYEKMEHAQGELQQLGGYEPQCIEKRNTDTQETLSALGNMVDWALVFIPGKAFTTGAGKIAATVTKVAQGTKYVEQAAKIAQGVEKVGKVLAKTDKVKDVVKTLEATQNSIRKDDSSKFNILNALSLEYWFGQVGKMIDGPPQLVEDARYRQAYLQEKEAIESKIAHAKQLEMMRLEQVNLLDSREAKLREEMRLQQKYEQQLKQELYEVEQRREQSLRAEQVVAYRKQFVQMFEQQMQSLLMNYRSNVELYLNRFIEHMPAVISMQLQQQLHTQKQQLEELVATRQQNKEQQLAYEQQLFSYLQILTR